MNILGYDKAIIRQLLMYRYVHRRLFFDFCVFSFEGDVYAEDGGGGDDAEDFS